MTNNKTFEESMDRLDKIVSLLERNEVGLDKSLELFEEGLGLCKSLNLDLNNFETKISELSLNIGSENE
jgi:exodeoxyribonuclease VII small subunit